MSQDSKPSPFRPTEPGKRKIVSSKPGYPIVVVEGPPNFNPFIVQASEWQSVVRVSIRQHYSPKTDSTVLLPSKKGIDLVPDLALAVAEAIEWVVGELRSTEPDLELAAVRDLGAVATEIEEEIPF